MRCSTLHGAAAQQSRAEAPLPPIAYVPPAVSRRGRRQRASSDAPPKPKSGFKLNASVAAPGTIGPRPAGRLAYARCRTGARASACKTLASRQPALRAPRFFDSVKQSSWVAANSRTFVVEDALSTALTLVAGIRLSFEPSAPPRRLDIVPRPHETASVV